MELNTKDTYEYICRQIDRETHLSRSRINTCLLVNGGLAAGAASQFANLNSSWASVLIFALASMAGVLINFESRAELLNSWKQAEYLQNCFEKLEDEFRLSVPRPFLEPKDFVREVPSFLRSYPNIFLALWAMAFSVAIAIYASGTNGEEVNSRVFNQTVGIEESKK